jgi:hypothetical protein
VTGRLPTEVRAALIKAAKSGGTLEQRNRRVDEIMARAKRNYPHLFKED